MSRVKPTIHIMYFNATCKKVEYIEEHFHPAGSIRYVILNDVKFNDGVGLFKIVHKEEMRRV